MEAFIKKHKFILVLTALVVCLSCVYSLTAKLDPTAKALTSNVSESDYSWATMSQAAAQYINQTASPEGNGANNVITPDNYGWAAGYFGYESPSSQDSKYVICSLQANNTVQYSYLTLSKLSDTYDVGSTTGNKWGDSARAYTAFGYAIQAIGVDEPVIMGATADNHRSIIGPVVLIMYLLSMALPEFFTLILTILSYANPFRLFLGSGSILRSIVPSIGDGTNAAFTNNSGSNVINSIGTALNTLANTVTSLYNTLYSLSFAVVIPIMIAITLFLWLIVHNGRNGGSVFKNLIVRVVFMGLGVPMLLACYTAAIDSVKDFTIGAATGTPNSVILSTFCDFGGWAIPSRAGSGNASPAYGGTSWGEVMGAMSLGDAKLTVNTDAQGYTLDSANTVTPRSLVQTINKMQGYNVGVLFGPSSNSTASVSNEDTTMVSSMSSPAYSDPSLVINLLQRYTKGETITASDWAARYTQFFADNKQDMMTAYNLSNNWADFDPNKAVAYNYNTSDASSSLSAGLNLTEETVKDFAIHRLDGTNPIGGNANVFMTGSQINNAHISIPDGNNVVLTGQKKPFNAMGMYNLLSSQFSDTAATVYSTSATATNQVQLAHYSVSIAGSGYLELAYVIDAIAIMACLMVLGYGYGFALLFGCLKSLIQMFPKVLTGMVGSLKGIAGSVALVAALIIEILGTCIMYALGSLFISGIYQLIEVPIATVMTDVVHMPQDAAILVTVVVSAVVIITITKKLLDYRVAIVRSVTETATAFINKFIGTNVVAPNLESSMNAGSIASIGLGMAMVGASNPTSASKLADGAANLKDKAMDTDLGKAATAALTGSSSTGIFGEKYASSSDAAKTSAKSDLSNNHTNTSSQNKSDASGYYNNNEAGRTASLANANNQEHKTADDKAANYVDENGDDFEKEIGYSGNEADGKSGLADRSNNLKNGVPANDQNSENDEDFDKKISAGSKASGSIAGKQKNVIDNSQEEITGTKTKDVSGSSKDSSDGQSSSRKQFVMTDNEGNKQTVSLVNQQTGAAYTQADKNAGVNYDVVDANGKSVYPNVKGGMNANTLAMQNGEATAMVAPGGGTNAYGGGGVRMLSETPAPTPVSTTASVSDSQVVSGTGSGSSQTIAQNTVAGLAGSSVQQAGTYATVLQNPVAPEASAAVNQTTTQNIQQGGNNVVNNMSQFIAGNEAAPSSSSGNIIMGTMSAAPIQNAGSSEVAGLSAVNQTVQNVSYVQSSGEQASMGSRMMAGTERESGNSQSIVNSSATYVTNNTVMDNNTSNTSNTTNQSGESGSDGLGDIFKKIISNNRT